MTTYKAKRVHEAPVRALVYSPANPCPLPFTHEDKLALLARVDRLASVAVAGDIEAIMQARTLLHALNQDAAPVTNTITCAGDWSTLAYAALPSHDREHVIVGCLSRRLTVIDIHVLSTGNAAASIIDTGIIVRRALLYGASSVMLAHNHPSGDASPSREDIRATRAVADGLTLLGIGLTDHVILTASGRHTSMREHGYGEVGWR